MTMLPAFSADAVKERMQRHLRAFVGHGRHISFAALAEDTGDDERKLRSYVEVGGPMIPLDVLMRIAVALPPEFFGRVARDIGFSAAPIGQDSDGTVRRALADASELVAQGTKAMVDGRLCHGDLAALAQTAAAVAPSIQALAIEVEI